MPFDIVIWTSKSDFKLKKKEKKGSTLICCYQIVPVVYPS